VISKRAASWRRYLTPWRAPSAPLVERDRDLAHQEQAHAAELSLLIDSATHYAIYMLDAEGRVSIWNKGAERIKGWR
jgi:two-component system sensor kinase FixL